MLGKRRGRKPGKKTVKTRSTQKGKRHWLDCQECGIEGAEVDGDVTVFTCALCVSKSIPWQLPKAAETAEKKALRLERKAARLTKKEAIANGTYVEPEKPEKLSFGRGWHRRLVFKAEVNGKMQHFSKGKKITKAQYIKLERTTSKKAKAKSVISFGRGWHFKKHFIAPNGDAYESGSLVTKASTQPTLNELQSLMKQHIKE